MSRMLAILSAAGLALCAGFLGLAFLIGGDNVFHDQRSLGRIKPLLDLATRKEWRWEGGDTLALNAPVNVRYEAKGPPRVSVTGPAETMQHVRVGDGRIVSDRAPRRDEPKMEAVISGVPIRKFVVNGRENLDLGHIEQESLDVHLNGKMVFPFAAELEAREIPFLFATAYGARGIPKAFNSHLVLQKPFGPVELRRALVQLSAA